MFPTIDQAKPGLKKLIAALGETYPYASVLAEADDRRDWRINRAGIGISASGTGGAAGFVVRVFDGVGCAEYSFNEFSEAKVPEICALMAKRLAEQNAATAEFQPLPTPIPADDPAELKKETGWKINPRELGDEAILSKITAIREKALAVDERVLDANVAVASKAYRKLFLSKNRDLDQTVMWTTAGMAVMASRGQEIKMSYKPFSVLGGAELLDVMDGGVEQVVGDALALLDSRPIPPGEYDCVCDPSTTGMIVHEAFGHGVEMDMFVKDRAQAKQFIGEYVASPLVTMHDGSAVDEAATMFFDDEGTLTGDTKNWGIQCMVTTAKEIKGGKLTGKIYSPIVLTGYVPDLLKSVTMMSSTPELSGSGFCGKGHKEWVKVSDGGPYMKARIRLG